MTATEFIVITLAGIAGGVANAVAGGGTFFTFPVLVAFGISTLEANATSAIALVPGSIAIGLAYRDETAARWRQLVPTAIISVIGGLAGGALLIAIGD
ncbi:MAG: TSUP family transporter, partial [Xanthobacteraceae bacterium]